MALIRLERKTKFWIRLSLALGIVFLCLLVFGAWFRNKYRIDPTTDVTVTIIGSGERYTKEEIQEHVLDKWYEKYSVLIDWYYRFRTAEPLPFLEKITVQVSEEGKVLITAYEKLPIGCILEMGNYLYFDADGVIVSTKTENVENLPVVTGVEYTSVALYQVFETKNTNLYGVVMNLVRQMEKYKVPVQEIHFMNDDAVVLYCEGHRISLGKREVYDVQISMIGGILEELAERAATGEEGGDVKYNINMENVYENGDRFYATEREDSEN